MQNPGNQTNPANPANQPHTDKPAGGIGNGNGNGMGIGPIVAGPAARGEERKPSTHASGDFHGFVADIEALVKDATSLTGEELAQAKSKLDARIATAKESIEASGHSIAQRARHTAEVTNEYVQAQPWKVLGAGAVLAFLVGLVLSKRS